MQSRKKTIFLLLATILFTFFVSVLIVRTIYRSNRSSTVKKTTLNSEECINDIIKEQYQKNPYARIILNIKPEGGDVSWSSHNCKVNITQYFLSYAKKKNIYNENENWHILIEYITDGIFLVKVDSNDSSLLAINNLYLFDLKKQKFIFIKKYDIDVVFEVEKYSKQDNTISFSLQPVITSCENPSCIQTYNNYVKSICKVKNQIIFSLQESKIINEGGKMEIEVCKNIS